VPAGADTQVQYNNAGAFGGDAGLTYVAAGDDLTVGDTVTAITHVGTGVAGGDTTAGFLATSTAPAVTLRATGEAVGGQYWRMNVFSNSLAISPIDAGGSSGGDGIGLSLTRSSNNAAIMSVGVTQGINFDVNGGSDELGMANGTLTISGTTATINSTAFNNNAGTTVFDPGGGTDEFTVTSGSVATGVKLSTVATAAGAAGLNLPHGTAPSAPVDGDIWTTTAGLFVRINGATVGPL
jgi:hypothetical protein